jgi:hypothetical protein
MSEALSETRERRVLDTELLWAFGVGVLVAATIGMILFTALTENINPPSNVERVDPRLFTSWENSQSRIWGPSSALTEP